ncbi:class I SAM-dependent methyltransferase [soil metagenome]
MNEAHEELCSSLAWAQYLATDVLPRVFSGADLGQHLLEVGPGFGLATDVLRTKVNRVTSVELDPGYAARLAERFANSNVDVVLGDATALQFADDSFSSAASFTMLHHVPSRALQDELLAEVARVLEPGGVFIGSDSLDSPGFRAFHAGDTCNPVDAEGFGRRLQVAGLHEVKVTAEWVAPEGEEEIYGTMFIVARKPR